MIGWWLLGRELDRWRAAGHRPLLWWRDDDAAGVTPALDRLTGLAERVSLPLLLAVVPGDDRAGGLDELGAHLTRHPGILVCQHGVTHADRRRPGEPRAEFPAWEPPAAIAAAIGAAWPRIAALPGSLPVFVPPWNTVHPALEAALDSLGLAISAAGGSARDQAPAEFDILQWKRGPAFRGQDRCLRRLHRLLRERRVAGDWARPVGLLTHHLDHDEAAWIFLETLLARTTADARIDWVSPATLLPQPAG